MIITIYRGVWKTEKSQVGLIYPPESEPFFVLELPWLNNQRCVSCIPTGVYVCKREPSTKNKDWKEAFFILDVPGRDNIICGHIANTPMDILGCMGFGLYYNGPDRIGSSTQAIYKWRDIMVGVDKFTLKIEEAPII